MPHVQQKAVIVGNAFQFAFDGAVELGSIGGRVVAKATVLEPAPNLLQGIQHRRVGRQFFQMQPGFETFDGFTNGIPLVHHPAIPNHNDAFLEVLMREIPERIIVVWDGGMMHKGDPIREAVERFKPRLHLEKLPPYAPMLNPLEQVWSWLKYSRLCNNAPADAAELNRAIKGELKRITDDHGFLLNMWHRSDLPVPRALLM